MTNGMPHEYVSWKEVAQEAPVSFLACWKKKRFFSGGGESQSESSFFFSSPFKMESWRLGIEQVSLRVRTQGQWCALLFSAPLLLPTILYCSYHHRPLPIVYPSSLPFLLGYSGMVGSRWPKVESSKEEKRGSCDHAITFPMSQMLYKMPTTHGLYQNFIPATKGDSSL